MVKRYSELFLESRKALSPQWGEQASRITRELLCMAAGKPAEAVIAGREQYATEEVCDAMEAMVKRAAAGEPIPYIIGEWDFYGMTLSVDRNVLIPRDDSGAVTELAIQTAVHLEQDPRILDLCTGSGCIGLAVANRVKDARVTLGDISKEALQVAKKNIGLQKLTGRVTVLPVDVMTPAAPFLGTFDLIVSNPPYVTTKEMQELPDSVKDFEPHIALWGGEDGLDFYRAICRNYTRALKSEGYLCLEFGMGQEEQVCAILEQAGYDILELKKDNSKIIRAVLARKKREEV